MTNRPSRPGAGVLISVGYTEGALLMEATPTFAGIDWSWQHHALCIVDDEGQRIEEATVPHSRPGLAKISALLRRHGVPRVGIERGDGPVEVGEADPHL